MNVLAATALAIAASTMLTIGLYFLKREAGRLPALEGGWRAWWAFVRDPWWVGGVGLEVVGYAIYLTALRDAPLSVIHTALNGGIALFVVLAIVGLGERVRGLEWVGVIAVVAGLIVLGLSLSESVEATHPARGTGLFSITLVSLAALALMLDRAPRRAIGLSIASGLMLGLSGIFAKALATSPSVAAAMCSTALLFNLAANITGFALMQGALQAGRGVVVVPIFSVLSNLVPILGGILLYGERIPGEGMDALLRPLAIVLSLGGAALLGALGEIDTSTPAKVQAASEPRR